MLDSTQIEGQWPTEPRAVLTGADSGYLEQYADRWSATWRRHWSLPLHLHIVDPTESALALAHRVADTVTWNRMDPEWVDSESTHYIHRTGRTQEPEKGRYIWLAGIYQAARFWVTGHRIQQHQQMVITDIDACATRAPSKEWLWELYRHTGFTRYKNRLMATFGSACGQDQAQWRDYSRRLEKILADRQGDSSMDQLLLKTVFSVTHNRLSQAWCCHYDLGEQSVEDRWRQYPVFHLKGARGKKVDISQLV